MTLVGFMSLVLWALGPRTIPATPLIPRSKWAVLQTAANCQDRHLVVRHLLNRIQPLWIHRVPDDFTIFSGGTDCGVGPQSPLRSNSHWRSRWCGFLLWEATGPGDPAGLGPVWLTRWLMESMQLCSGHPLREQS